MPISTMQIVEKYIRTQLLPQFHKRIQQKFSQESDFENGIQNWLDLLWDEIGHHLFEHIDTIFTDYPEFLKKPDLQGEIYQFLLRFSLNWTKKSGLKLSLLKPKERQDGKIYTPFPITNFIAKFLFKCISLKPNDLSKSENVLKIADLACGTGRFLRSWATEIEQQQDQIKTSLHGFDKDEKALAIAQQLGIKRTKWTHLDVLFDPLLERSNQFHVIMGNPPYIESRAISDAYWENIRKKYSFAYHKFDLSVVFLEKIIQLLKPNGWAGIITSNKWLVSKYGRKIREFLLNHVKIYAIFDISQVTVFKGISSYPIIIFFQKISNQEIISSNSIKIAQISRIQELYTFLAYQSKIFVNIPQEFYLHAPNYIISTDLDDEAVQILKHMWTLPSNYSIKLGDSQNPYLLKKGIHTGNIKKKLFTSDPLENDSVYKHAITSRQKVERYHIAWQGLWVRYDPSIIDKKHGEYASLREQWIFERWPKIFIKLFGTRLQAALDFYRYYANNSLILVIRKPENTKKNWFYNPDDWFIDIEQEFYYLTGLLNSKLISKFYQILYKHTHVRGNYLQFYIKDLKQIPLIRPTSQNQHILHAIADLAKKLETYYSKPELDKIQIMRIEEKLDQQVQHLYWNIKNL